MLCENIFKCRCFVTLKLGSKNKQLIKVFLFLDRKYTKYFSKLKSKTSASTVPQIPTHRCTETASTQLKGHVEDLISWPRFLGPSPFVFCFFFHSKLNGGEGGRLQRRSRYKPTRRQAVRIIHIYIDVFECLCKCMD